jgi:hypothetical protein
MSALLAALIGGVVLVQPSADAMQTLLKAAVTLRTFDHFAAACARGPGFDQPASRVIASWMTSQRVAQVRARVDEAERNPRQKEVIVSAVESIAERLRAQAIGDCAVAVSVTKTSEAQFATSAPDLAGAPATGATSSPAAPVAPPQPSSTAAAAAPSVVTPELLAAIDSVGFDTRAGVGVGGFITTEIVPIVLFRNGDVLTDVRGLTAPGGLAAHKAANPARWTRRQRAGSELQIARSKGFVKLPFQVTYATLPAGFRLRGMYRRLGGAGTLGVGGTSSVAVWDQFRFTADGAVERGGGAGASSEAGDTSTVTRSTAAARRGTYRIDGLVLHITYEDGATAQHILITDPDDAKGAIWIDGHGYARRGE